MDPKRPPDYDRHPHEDFPGHTCHCGWDAIAARLRPATAVIAGESLRPAAEIEALVEPFSGGDDPVFGFISPLRLGQFFDGAALGKIRQSLDATNGMRLVAGVGATLVVPRPDVLVYAETFIMPASVGPCTIRPHGPSIGKRCATMKAFVRHKP